MNDLQLAEDYALGQERLRLSSRATVVRAAKNVGIGLVVTVAGFLLLGLAPGEVMQRIAYIATSIGLLLLYIGISDLIGSPFVAVQSAIIYEQGVVAIRGDNVHVIRWEDIQDVRMNIWQQREQSIKVINRFNFFVTMMDGQRVKFTRWLDNIAELSDIINREVTNRQLPAAMQTLKSGGELDFGPLRLSQQGIIKARGDELLQWHETAAVMIGGRYIRHVMVYRQGKKRHWLKVKFQKVPNPVLLMTIVNEAVGLNAA